MRPLNPMSSIIPEDSQTNDAASLAHVRIELSDADVQRDATHNETNLIPATDNPSFLNNPTEPSVLDDNSRIDEILRHLESPRAQQERASQFDCANLPPLPDSPDSSNEIYCSCMVDHKWGYTGKAREEHNLKAANNAWVKCSNKLREHDQDLAEGWKDEIDQLLVFTGLFSAVLTAFNVAIFVQLNPDPTPDATLQVLFQISAQLSDLRINNNSITSVSPAFNPTISARPPSTASIWINVLWFSSLVLSLSIASIGIVVRQWLSYFASMPVAEARESAYIDFLRYDRGLVAWRVPQILSMLPVLLQSALFLFFIGLAILLSTLNSVVAAVAIALIVISLFFVIFTTFAPSIWPRDCPYRSPQALVGYWVVQYSILILTSIIRQLYRLPFTIKDVFEVCRELWRYKLESGRRRVSDHERQDRNHDDNASFSESQKHGDDGFFIRIVRSLREMVTRYSLASLRTINGALYSIISGVFFSLRSLRDWLNEEDSRKVYMSWSAQERGTIDEGLQQLRIRKGSHVEDLKTEMDVITWKVLAGADLILSDDTFLNDVIRPCINEPGYPAHITVEHLAHIIHSRLSRTSTTSGTLSKMVFDLIPRMIAEPKTKTVVNFGSLLGRLALCCTWEDTICIMSAYAQLYRIHDEQRKLHSDNHPDDKQDSVTARKGEKNIETAQDDYVEMSTSEYDRIAYAFVSCAKFWRNELDNGPSGERRNVNHSDVQHILQYSSMLLKEKDTHDREILTALHSTCVTLRLASYLSGACYARHIRQPLRALVKNLLSACEPNFFTPADLVEAMSNFVEDAQSLATDRESDLLEEIARLENDMEQLRQEDSLIPSEALEAVLQQFNTAVDWLRASFRRGQDTSDQGSTIRQPNGGHGNDDPASEAKAPDGDAPGEVDLQGMQEVHFDLEQHDEEHEKSQGDDESVM